MDKKENSNETVFRTTRRLIYGHVPSYIMSIETKLLRGARLLSEIQSREELINISRMLNIMSIKIDTLLDDDIVTVEPDDPTVLQNVGGPPPSLGLPLPVQPISQGVVNASLQPPPSQQPPSPPPPSPSPSEAGEHVPYYKMIKTIANTIHRMAQRLYKTDNVRRPLSMITYLSDVSDMSTSELHVEHDYEFPFQGIIMACIVPVIMGCSFESVDKTHIKIKESVDIFKILDSLTLPPGLVTDELCSNIYSIATRTDVSMFQRILSIYMEFTATTPIAIESTLRSRTHLGFTIDFMKRECIHSADVIVTTPLSHDIIVSPGKTTADLLADKSVRGKMSCTIQSVSNMLSGGSVIASCAYPNTNAASVCMVSDQKPLISLDSITRCGVNGSFADTITYLTDNEKMGPKNVQCILDRVVTMHRCIDASRYLGRRYAYCIATYVSRYVSRYISRNRDQFIAIRDTYHDATRGASRYVNAA